MHKTEECVRGGAKDRMMTRVHIIKTIVHLIDVLSMSRRMERKAGWQGLNTLAVMMIAKDSYDRSGYVLRYERRGLYETCSGANVLFFLC